MWGLLCSVCVLFVCVERLQYAWFTVYRVSARHTSFSIKFRGEFGNLNRHCCACEAVWTH